MASQTNVPHPEPLVLIVDDHAGIRAYMRRCLAPFTRHTLEAADGVEALTVARAALPDGLALVIVDVAMPRMNGLELHAILRSNPAFAEIPVLFVSGERTPVPEGTLLEKPFNARTLRAAVHAALRIA
jgi:CheY-like chemotaxis protein